MKGMTATISLVRWMAVVLVPIALLLTGCFGSQTAKRYFEIKPPVVENPLQKTERRILIEPVTTSGIYDDFRIVYRVSPYQINYYSYDFWAKKPARMIHSAIFHFLQTCGGFDRIDEMVAPENPDVIFKSKLNAIEEIDGGAVWYARLALELEMTDYKTGATIIKHSFDRRRALPKRDIVLFPKMISEILEQELRFLLHGFVEESERES